MQDKVYINGQKAFQRGNDTEDRSLVYRNWLRTIEVNGFFLDIDFIKWKRKENLEYVPIAITELTRCDRETAEEPYRKAIEERIFNRDCQGDVARTLGRLLKIPVYLVLFQKDMKWLQVYSFNKRRWKGFTPDEWAIFLKNL